MISNQLYSTPLQVCVHRPWGNIEKEGGLQVFRGFLVAFVVVGLGIYVYMYGVNEMVWVSIGQPLIR